MHASIRRYIVSAGRETDAIRHAQVGFLPILQRQPGFLAYYFVNTGDGEMLGVSVFTTAEGAEAANVLAMEYVREHLSDTLKRTMLLEGPVVAHASSSSA
jgi:hypothetical protein